MTSILFSKMISIFIMLVIGWICSQLAIVDKSTKDKLTVLSTQIVTPCLVFMSFQIEFDAHLLQNMGIAFAVSMLIHVGAIFASRFAIRNDGKHDNAVERLMLIYTNCGFMGFPLAYAVAGNEGVIYATTYNAAFTIFVWTQGIGMFRDKGGSFSWRKVLNPAIIATALGLLCFLIRFYVPESVGFALDSIGDMNTPLAMIIAGAVIGELNLKNMLLKKRTYYIIAMKLLVFPAIFCLILRFLPLEEMVKLIMGMLAACPSGAIGIMLAILYKRDDHYAAEIFAMTTLFSIVTIPLCMFLL